MHLTGSPLVGATITELFTGEYYGKVNAINAAAVAVGRFEAAPLGMHACRWQDGNITDLQAPVGEYQDSTIGNPQGGSYETVHFDSEAHGINASGGVVGFLHSTVKVKFPFSYLAIEAYEAFLNMVGLFPGRAFGINAAGQVVGDRQDTGWDGRRAVLWENGATRDLFSTRPASGEYSEAYAINDNGQVAGYSQTQALAGGYLWRDGHIVHLGDSRPRALNQAGTVVGRYVFGPNLAYIRAFLWQDGIRRELPELPGDTVTDAYGINSANQVVGQSLKLDSRGSPVGYSRAVMWQNGVVQDLNQMLPAGSGWTLRTALAINDFGQIVGEGVRGAGEKGYLLTPRNLNSIMA